MLRRTEHTSSCVDPLVSIYLFLTSLISMSLWNAASSLRTPDANWAAILAAMAAAAAAASDALLTSFVVLGGVDLSSFVEVGWSHLLLEDIEDDGGLRARRVDIKRESDWVMYIATFFKYI